MKTMMVGVAIALQMVAIATQAGNLYKCVEAGGIVYQQQPCKDGAGKLDIVDHAQRPSSASMRRQMPMSSIQIGMSAKEVMAYLVARGTPPEVNQTRTSRLVHEQWVVSDGRYYLYFHNGILTAIQQ